MLTQEMIQNNKARYIELLKSTGREGMDDLLEFLETTDIYTAPASTKYHSSYKGGLVEHMLNVYDNLMKLYSVKFACVDNLPRFDNSTLTIVALTHDFGKINFYEQYFKNVKVGNQWVQESAYKVREAQDRLLYGNHEQNSLFWVSRYLPLTVEEEIAILHHHLGMSDDCAKDNISEICNRYDLVTLLHCADLMATFMDEKYEQHN